MGRGVGWSGDGIAQNRAWKGGRNPPKKKKKAVTPIRPEMIKKSALLLGLSFLMRVTGPVVGDDMIEVNERRPGESVGRGRGGTHWGPGTKTTLRATFRLFVWLGIGV